MSGESTVHAAPDTDAVLARATELLDAHKLVTLGEMSAELETLSPSTEAQWRTMLRIFSSLKKPAWAEIATRRFLENEPGNIPARMQEIEGLCALFTRKEEVRKKLEELRDVQIKDKGMLLVAGYASLHCEQLLLARDYFAAAVAMDPDDPNTVLTVASHYRMRMMFREGLAALHTLTAFPDYNTTVLNTIVALSRQMNDVKHAKKVLPLAVEKIDSAHNYVKMALLDHILKLEEFHLISKILTSIDVSSMRSDGELKGLYTAIEGRGFRREEQLILDRIAAIDPTKSNFESTVRHQVQSSGVFAFPDPEEVFSRRPGLVGRMLRALRGPRI